MNLQEFKNCLDDTFDDLQQKQLKEVLDNYHDIMILGNGGSNAIASHIAEDYTKMMGKRAISFGDTPLLSCYANDYGWDNAFKMFAEHYLIPNSLVILLSSSGRSKNILNAAEYVKDKAAMITLSGFDYNNPLRTNYQEISLMHFYVPSKDYGIVETMHQLILHSVIECVQ